MQALHSAGDDGTDFVGAKCDNEICVLNIDGIDGLGHLRPDVDADFCHDGDCLRIHARRLTARALDVYTISKQMARQPLRHLTASGIRNAEKYKLRGRHQAIIDW